MAGGVDPNPDDANPDDARPADPNPDDPSPGDPSTGDWRGVESAQTLLYARHKHTAARASRGKLIVAEQSDHAAIYEREPDLAIGAVRAVLDAARR